LTDKSEALSDAAQFCLVRRSISVTIAVTSSAVSAVNILINRDIFWHGHQTVSLAARHLEENGIATVVMGCAKDIVEFVGVPRFLFSDFPLGNAAGRPKDPQSQAFTLELALRVLEAAPAARTTVQSPLRWSEVSSWKLDYSNIERLSPEEIRRRREEFDRQKDIARNIRDKRGSESQQ
jgi:D-proline reductase (dithiol) PrdB